LWPQALHGSTTSPGSPTSTGGKPNGEALYGSLDRRFRDEFGVAEFAYFRKPSPSSPVPRDLMDEIEATDPDAVVIAIADCGSCNSSAVVDAKTFEAKGVPTVQVITDEFLELNGRISESHGVDQLPVITLDHPTRYHDAEEIDAIAERIYRSVHTGLTCEECLRLGR
jgi:hypothetical protein